MPENFSLKNTNRSFFNGSTARSALNGCFSVMFFLFVARQMFHAQMQKEPARNVSVQRAFADVRLKFSQFFHFADKNARRNFIFYNAFFNVFGESEIFPEFNRCAFFRHFKFCPFFRQISAIRYKFVITAKAVTVVFFSTFCAFSAL